MPESHSEEHDKTKTSPEVVKNAERLHVVQKLDILSKKNVEKMSVNTFFVANVGKSCVVSIQNLTRPFTKVQLRNLLKRTGKIVEQGLWIDQTKSHALVQVMLRSNI